jgi:uncharacterized membrane protein
MSLANIFSGQASPAPLADIPGLRPADLEQLATIAWQWLLLSALVAWVGALIAGYRLLTAFRGQQQAEIAAVLHTAMQRQRRQSWLWLSIIVTGSGALFWLRLPHVLPQQQLNQAPDWAAIGSFLLAAPEGWLWLGRGGLALLALGLVAALSISAYRRARAERPLDPLARSSQRRTRWRRRGSARSGARNASLTPGSRNQTAPSGISLPAASTLLEQRFQAERRQARLSLIVVAALLATFLFPLSGRASVQLPITAVTLNGVVLLALAVWVGGMLYLAAVLAPASHIIEGAERTQTLVETCSASRPSLIPPLFAIALYSIFSVETQLTTSKSWSALLNTPAAWLLIAELVLVGAILLLTVYQARRALPALAQAAWLAARGTVMSVLGGMDVSRSLQISQRERQMRANQAERRLTRIAYAQVLLGMLVLLCLVLASFFGGPITM